MSALREPPGRAERRPGHRDRIKRRFDIAFYMPSITPLLVPDAHLLPPGGAQTQIFLLCQALAGRGAHVALIVEEPPAGIDLPAEVNGVQLVARPAYQAHSPMIGKVREAFRIWHTLRTVQPETLVSRMCGADVGILGVYARTAGTRFVYSSASVADFAPERMLPKRRDIALYRLGVRLADRIVVQTEEQVDLCRARFGTEPALIKSIAELGEISNSEPSYFLWIARLVDYKNPMAYIELARDVPEAKFLMLGVPNRDTHEARIFAQRVRTAAASVPNLEILTPRPREQLNELLKRAIAVVNTGSIEGMPNVFLEGWSRGVPALALAHDPGGVIERENVGGFGRGSQQRFAELARELWQRRHHLAALRRRCREYVVRHHSPDAVVAQWLQVLAGEDS